MPPRDSNHGIKPAKLGLRQRIKARLTTQRARGSSIEHEPPVNQKPRAKNDADRNESPTTSGSKAIVEGTDASTEFVVKPCEESPQIALVNDGVTGQRPSELWSEAFSSLKPADQAQLKEVLGDDQVSIFGMPDFDALKAEVLRKQTECEEKAWKVSVGDHVIIVRDLAAKSATWLQKLGDMAVPFAPTAASAPWGLVKVFLQVQITYDENMFVLLASLEDALKVVYHGYLYETLYTPDRIPSGVLRSLHSELLEIYKSALELIAYTQKQITDGTVRHIVEAFINPDGVGGLLADLKTRHADLSRAAQLCESHRSAAADDRLIGAVRGISEPLVRFEQRCEAKFKEIEDGEMISTLHAISQIPYTSHHQTYQEERTPGTCEWILQDDEFRSWTNSSSPGVFWLWGMPGVGKSFLTSKVIDHFQEAFKKTPNHEGLAFFYCRRSKNEEERSKPLSVIQSFLRQLACYVNRPELIQLGLIEAVKQIRKVGGIFSRDKCEDLLLKSFDLYPCTTLIIDALDECDVDSRRDLIRFLSSIPSRASRPVKIFISSRPDDDIKRAFSVGLNVGVHANMTEQDMRLFLDQKLEVMEDNISIKRMRNEISTRLFAKCSGMFQWANLQLEQLKRCTTRETIEARLNSLPTSLKKAYDEIFDQMEEDDSQGRLLVSRAVMWVMCADQEVTSDLLLSAIRVNPAKEALDISNPIDEQELLRLSRHLLVIDMSGSWRVSHLSVTEYFEKHHCTVQEAHFWVGNACLLALLDGDGGYQEANGQTERDPKCLALIPRPMADQLGHSFKVYMLHRWYFHIEALNGSQITQINSTTALLVRFFGSPTMSSAYYRRWISEVNNADNLSMLYTPQFGMSFTIQVPVPFEYTELDPPEFPMLGICRMGIYTALGDWWINIGDCREQANSEGKGLVQLAAEANCVPICERLINEGAPIEVLNPGASLLAAITHCNLDLFRLLRTSNRRDWECLVQHLPFRHLFCGILMAGHHDILELLCYDNMADVDMEIETPGCANFLAAAALSNKELSVKRLIRGGANANLPIRHGQYGSALAAAASIGALSIVKYLIQCGANVNLPLTTGSFGSALIAASHSGSKELVEYLLQVGAYPNYQPTYGRFGSALIAATHCGDLEIVKCLVAAGADVNFRPRMGDFGSVLATAAISGNRPVMDYLIGSGADVSLPFQSNMDGSTLVDVICSGGYENMATIKYLVEAGADLNTPLLRGRYGSPLIAAIECGSKNLDVTKYLVESGADVNLQLNYGHVGSALAAAVSISYHSSWNMSSKLNLELVDYLVKSGANVNLPLTNGDYANVLALASHFGDSDLIDYLVECGAH